MRKPVAYIVVFMVLLSLCSVAQNDQTLQRKYSVWLGSRMLKVDSLPNIDHLDFMNYPETQNRFMETFHLGFSGHFRLAEEWEFDIKAVLMRGLIPNNFNISVQYSPTRHLGFNLGVYSFPVYFRQFFTYHLLEDQFHILDTLHVKNLTSIFNDVGLVAGPVISMDHRLASIILKLNGGVGSFMPFEESVFQKKINSNERRRIVYKGSISPAILFMPELELCFSLFKTRVATLGIQLQGNAFMSSRAIHYKRSTHIWICDESVSKRVKNPSHKYQMFTLDAGVFWKFH